MKIPTHPCLVMWIFCLSPSFCGIISFFLTEHQCPGYFWISHYLDRTLSVLWGCFTCVCKAAGSLRMLPGRRHLSHTCSTTFSHILYGQQKHLPQEEPCPAHREINTEKVLSTLNFDMLGEGGKERKMGPIEFPRMQFPRDHEATEKLVVAKDEPKRKKTLATHLLFTLYPPYNGTNVCHTVLWYCVTPRLHTLSCSSFEREAQLKGCARSLSLEESPLVRGCGHSGPRQTVLLLPRSNPHLGHHTLHPRPFLCHQQGFLNAERNDRHGSRDVILGN